MNKSKQIRADFQRFLATSGYCTPPGKAACALRSARILAQWRDAESAGLVRLVAEPEQENYFDVYGEPDGGEREHKAIARSIELYGNWCLMSQVNNGTEYSGDDWKCTDSISMCAGYRNPLDPFENDYVIDLMSAALAQIPQPGNVDELCSSL